MERLLLFFFVVGLLTACNNSVSTPSALPSLPSDVTPQTVTTGATEEGLPIAVAPIDVGSTHRLQVTRGRDTFWLKASDLPNRYGCEIGYPSYDTFGCYFPLTIVLVDVDANGEPEVLSWWEHGSSGSHRSFHLHRWNGSTYQLVGDFFEQQLEFELQDLNDDGSQELILRYVVGPHQMAIPWIDVYTLSSKGQLLCVNDEYPEFYTELQKRYEERLPAYEWLASQGWHEALTELKRRIEMVKSIADEIP